MTRNEAGIFEGAMRFLDAHNDPPSMTDPARYDWWETVTNDLLAFGNAWHNHPLVLELGVALHAYLEVKAKAKGGEQHVC